MVGPTTWDTPPSATTVQPSRRLRPALAAGPPAGVDGHSPEATGAPRTASTDQLAAAPASRREANAESEQRRAVGGQCVTPEGAHERHFFGDIHAISGLRFPGG